MRTDQNIESELKESRAARAGYLAALALVCLDRDGHSEDERVDRLRRCQEVHGIGPHNGLHVYEERCQG